MTDKKSFGNFIKAKRLEKNYSQKELAELLYVTESAVSKWERGVSYPDVSLITDICRALDLSEHELLSASVDTNARKEKYEAKVYRKIARTWFWIPTICYIITIKMCIRDRRKAIVIVGLLLKIDYYNNHEEPCWTEETARKRIHQVLSMVCYPSSRHFKGVSPVFLFQPYVFSLIFVLTSLNIRKFDYRIC